MTTTKHVFLIGHPARVAEVRPHFDHLSDCVFEAGDVYEFQRRVQTDRPQIVIIDLVTVEFESNARMILEWIPQHIDFPVRLFGLTDGTYPRKLVSLIDGLGLEPLAIPLTHEAVADTIAVRRNGHSPEPPKVLPERALRACGREFATRTAAMFPMIQRLDQIARHNVTLLLAGETGTGKTHLARIIHDLSDRRDERFLTTACGALPPDLIESELFGHVRGAFTSADRSKVGRFEAAEAGTLLLDEIDVLSPKEQAKLLRVIETGEYEPVGSAETKASNVRLIVASNVDLQTLASEGEQFRSDLYYRLNVMEFRLLPLRERPLDIAPLAMKFVDEICQEHGIAVDRVAVKFLNRLARYHWPGNLRELNNQIRRAVLLSADGTLSVDSLTDSVLESATNGHAHVPRGRVNGAAPGSFDEQIAKSEREILLEALRANNDNRSATARALGISRVGLYKKMRRVGLMPPTEEKQRQPA